MSPQFVDFNGDGHLDIVAGTFDGSPHVALGSKEGFRQPTMILDENGDRIVVNQFWNYDEKKWDKTERCDPEGTEVPSGHLTSAVAFDWNGDGVLDLLLGDYTNGRLYRRENRGTNASPKFSTRNIPVMAGGQPLGVTGKLTTMRPLDWDGDGLLDLVCGSFGDSYNDEPGGGVFLFRNTGSGKQPEFAKAVTFVTPSPKGGKTATRPDAGLYPEVVDWNGDQVHDLLVGGYSMWTPEARELSKAERARADELQASLSELTKKNEEINEKISSAVRGLKGEEVAAKFTEERKKFAGELQALAKQRRELQGELDTLVPSRQRKSFVWVYLGAAPSKAGPGSADPPGDR